MEKYMHSLKLCALRETFEETGLLLLPSPSPSPSGLPTSRAVGHEEAGMSADEWANARNDVHHNAVDFAPFIRKVSAKLGITGKLGKGEGSLPELAPMAHYSNWITPRSVVRPAKRFDAHFFITVLDKVDVFGDEESLKISADGSETLSLRLQTPREIMYAGITDQISLFPPQFYILADLETALLAADAAGRIPILPLIFDSGQATDRATADAEFRVTPVEEESRGLQGRNYSWDRKDSSTSSAPLTSWISDTNAPLSNIRALGTDPESQYPSVTAVEPRAFPKLGTMMDISKEIVENRSRAQVGESEDSFVFPLVLPGDWQASPAQKERARKGLFLPGTGEQTANNAGGSSSAEDEKSRPLNRLYVSPRAKEHGGGMTVRGAVRKGLTHLRDFQVGVLLAEEPAEEDERKSKL
uniref:Nudix hydrolase domain-containing protein n=2 Tax=Kalmanozyma brasiliensis (strain GHG001) TaxID=1365824 RepID=V5EIS1_KALBG